MVGGIKMIVTLINRDTNEDITFTYALTMTVVDDEILIIDKNYNQCIFPLNDWLVTVI